MAATGHRARCRYRRGLTLPFDHDTTPQRYRLGTRTARAQAATSLCEWAARLLGELDVGLVADVGCADGVLRAAIPTAAICRDDSPEFAAYWTRPTTSFDAEEAPGLTARVFDVVTVQSWDAPLIRLPGSDAVRDYLLGRQVPDEVAVTAARQLPVPLRVTKRGAPVVSTRGAGSLPAAARRPGPPGGVATPARAPAFRRPAS